MLTDEQAAKYAEAAYREATDEYVDDEYYLWENMPEHECEGYVDFARAVIDAYERDRGETLDDVLADIERLGWHPHLIVEIRAEQCQAHATRTRDRTDQGWPTACGKARTLIEATIALRDAICTKTQE